MNAERLEQVQELYHLARGCEPSECSVFLAQACRGDEELRREVESLLAQDSSDPLMQWPAMEVAASLLAEQPVTQVGDGTQLGPYKIESSLGAGGMGQVYKARDTRLGRAVAIKIANRRFSERFEREAHSISALNHPHICTLYDVGPNYLVMELVEGETLAASLSRGALSIDLALRYGAAIADALAEAHSKGIVHRDLKPGNIMVNSSGVVKIIDFGLAKLNQSTGTDDPAMPAGPKTGAGTVMGTALYMSPEQAEGKPVDARSDVFSTGVVLYEMLTGTRAFASDSTAGVLSKVLRDTPRGIRELRPEAPEAVARIVRRCLEKDAALRYPSGRELASDLFACVRPAPVVRFPTRARVLTAAVLIATIALGGWLYYRGRRALRARDEALPKIRELMTKGNYPAVFDLTRTALNYVPDDPQLKQYWSEVAYPVSLTTTPPGAKVSYRAFGEANLPWRLLGQTPFEDAALPTAYLRFRVEKEGWEPEEFATFAIALQSRNIPLERAGQVPARMLKVRAQAPWVDPKEAMPLPDYFLDKFEVTNGQFQQFINAGGYRDRKYWRESFRKDGRAIPLEQALASFRDGTGRQGPAGWELGAFPKNQGNFPVGGVSWFEAAAYCEYAGKALPTVHHWRKAAGLGIYSEILLFSNFASTGPLPVGAHPGITSFGAYDMAGNVKEWCRNSAGELRAILGGGWTEPPYAFYEPDAQDPFARDATFGIRCAAYPSDVPTAALEPIGKPARDYSIEKPAGDDTFEIFRRMYSYDKTPLDVKTESVDDSNENWRKEKVSYRAAYNGERIPAYLYVPKNAKPPYQTVLWLPGGYAWHIRDSAASFRGPSDEFFSFLLRTGRAVLYPVYKGTYERRVEGSGPNAYRDSIVQLVKDASTSVDFLESRSDIQSANLGYYGLSTGAYYGVLILALEPRLKTGVLVSGGLSTGRPPAEVDPFNFARQVRVPVLMVNGRYDFVMPSATSQEPMFRLLGVPERDKRLAQSDAGHMPLMQDLMREVLNWFDQRLGPVETK
jgi:tRNA A-37 threonylcarbamoyl transferase component Bud32/dienelactone hydrolase